MITVKKIKSGKILFEDYSALTNLQTDSWTFHPNVSRFYIDQTSGQLNIIHGTSPTYMLRDLPENFVFELQNTYNPSEDNDMGGIVIYEGDDEKLELYEYYNATVGTIPTYPHVRLKKTGEKYDGYGSQDGRNWDIRGSIIYEHGNKFGLALEGEQGDNLKIEKIKIFESTKIKIKGMPSNSRAVVSLDNFSKDMIGQGVENNHEIEFDLFNYVFPLDIIITIYDSNNTVFAESDINDVFGGDEFHCGNFLELYYNNSPLDALNNDFGYIDSFYKDYRLEIKNMINVAHENINLEIKKYLNEFGDEWIQVCKDNNGVPNNTFSKSLIFDSIDANGSVYFWVRITRGSIPVSVDDYLFDFVINVF